MPVKWRKQETTKSARFWGICPRAKSRGRQPENRGRKPGNGAKSRSRELRIHSAVVQSISLDC